MDIYNFRKSEHHLKISTDVSKLIYEANKEYYSLFSPNKKCVIENIKNQLFEINTEVSNTRVFLNKNTLLGLTSFYPADAMQLRQIISLKMLLKIDKLDKDIMHEIRKFRKGLCRIDKNSLYLSRFTVSKYIRKKGIGCALIKDFENTAYDKGFNIVSLHVNRNNIPAIRFYLKNNYKVNTNSKDFQFYTMEKIINKCLIIDSEVN